MARPYDNSRREAAARETHARVVEVAHRLLLERGYGGWTMAELAEASGVSVPQLYKTFGTRPRLVKSVYDVRLAGDTEPVAMIDRPWVRELREQPDPRLKLAVYARVARGIVERAGPLLVALLAAARAGDPDLADLAATTDRERLFGATSIATHLDEGGHLAAGLSAERARDLVWLHTAPDTYRMLVLDRGWSLDDYEEWLAASLARTLLG